MVGWIGVLLVAIFLAELDRIPCNAAARTADVLLRAAPEHGSGVLVADDARLIYSWTPLRFAAGGLREVMYFGGLDATHSNALILWGVAVGFLVLSLSSGFRFGRATDAAPTSVTSD